MKKQCKKIGMLLIAVMLLMLTGCAQNGEEASVTLQQGESDLKYVQEKGTLVVGITDYAPLDYREGDKWTGFDVDLAKAFADSLGVKLELIEIDWDKKVELLEQGKIDCIWNGMTMTKELQETISCSQPYLSNAQVVVLQSGEMKRYKTEESCQHLLFAVEAGSTGEALLKEKNYRYISCLTQLKALESVQKKQADAAVVDIIIASSYIETRQQFGDLGFEISLNDEKDCVGFRKGSDMTEKANKFLQTVQEDGTIRNLAKKYKIEEAIQHEKYTGS